MTLPKKMTEAEYEEHRETNSGLCLACGEIKFGDTEPDAENYECDSCGEHQVQGIENAMVDGNIEIVEISEEEG
jgi:hypothetical protein